MEVVKLWPYDIQPAAQWEKKQELQYALGYQFRLIKISMMRI